MLTEIVSLSSFVCFTSQARALTLPVQKLDLWRCSHFSTTPNPLFRCTLTHNPLCIVLRLTLLDPQWRPSLKQLRALAHVSRHHLPSCCTLPQRPLTLTKGHSRLPRCTTKFASFKVRNFLERRQCQETHATLTPNSGQAPEYP